MNKRTIVALIIAVILILAGGLLVTAGMATSGFTPGNFGRIHAQERTYVAAESFDSIQLTATVSDVSFVKTADTFRVVCTETDKLSYTVIVEEDVLKIDAVELRDWRDYIGFFDWADLKMTVYLPEDAYSKLYVQTDTGDVTIPDSFTFSSAEVLSDTGDIDCAAQIQQNLAVCTSTGDIEVHGCAPAALSLRSDTGDIRLGDIPNGGDLQILTSTGEIRVANVTGRSISLESDTGDQDLQRVLAEQSVNILSHTGDVSLLACDAPEITIETDTGDISGVLVTPKDFFAHTDTGKEQIASHSGTVNGKCYVNSNTGDIMFSYQP